MCVCILKGECKLAPYKKLYTSNMENIHKIKKIKRQTTTVFFFTEIEVFDEAIFKALEMHLHTLKDSSVFPKVVQYFFISMWGCER